MTVTVAGVDGCRAGWVCVLIRAEAPFLERAFIARTIGEIIHHCEEPAVIAIDIPIGLPERITGAGRECDVALRAKLGKRAPAVFAVPARAALDAAGYRSACAAAAARSDPPRQISQQMFRLLPKVREVDAAITPGLQGRVYECHPEGAFWAMNGFAALGEPKKLRGKPHSPGLAQRRALLIGAGFSASTANGVVFGRSEAALDDLLDACACAWTAARIANGEAIRFPPHEPPRDSKGLRMEILA